MERTAASRPNVLLILADDLGYGDFGAFNGGLSETPHLDALAAESVCLTQHYAASPVCNPSRAALLTGRYPHRTGSIDTLEWRGLERLALRERTLADALSAAGYATGLVGKWHLGAFDPRYHPARRGFDETICFRGGMHDYWDWRLDWGDSVRRADGRYLTDVWTDEAVGFLRRHAAAGGGAPFFLHLAYNAPHTPLQVPEEEAKSFLENGRQNRGVSTLYGMIRRMDRGIGRVLETLKEVGAEANTLVLFCSDNGPQFGGKGDNKLDRFNCGFRGAKTTVYEGGVRVPALVRWPDGLPGGGREVRQFVHMCDWYPTLLAAAGVDLPADGLPLDGGDVLPVLRGERDAAPPKRFWQWNRYTPLAESNAAMRDGDWKLVRPAIGATMAVPDIHWLEVSMYRPEHFIENGIVAGPDPPREVPPPPPPQLFHLGEDPGEGDDRADREQDRVRRMLRELETWFEGVEADRAAIRD